MNRIRAFVSITTALLATSLSLPPAFGDYLSMSYICPPAKQPVYPIRASAT